MCKNGNRAEITSKWRKIKNRSAKFCYSAVRDVLPDLIKAGSKSASSVQNF
jgi:hypothetical protein